MAKGRVSIGEGVANLGTTFSQERAEQIRKELGLGTDTEPKTSPNTLLKTSTETDTNTYTYTSTKTDTKTLPKTETKLSTSTNTVSSTITDLKASLNAKKKKFEDGKERKTVWMTDDTISQLEKLAKRTNRSKFEIVEIAIQELYNLVFEESENN